MPSTTELKDIFLGVGFVEDVLFSSSFFWMRKGERRGVLGFMSFDLE